MLPNTMNALWFGAPVAAVRAARSGEIKRETSARRDVVRKRWRQAVAFAGSSRGKLLASVDKLYDSLDMFAQSIGYRNLAHLVYVNLGELMKQQADALWDKYQRTAAVQSVRLGTSAVACSASLPAAAGYAAANLLLFGWDKVCDRLKTAKVIDQYIKKGATKAWSATWNVAYTAGARFGVSVVNVAFRQVLANKLREWVYSVDRRLESLIDYDRLLSVIQTHPATVGNFLLGKDADLKRLVLDIAAAMDPCVVQAVITRFTRVPQVSADCQKRVPNVQRTANIKGALNRIAR